MNDINNTKPLSLRNGARRFAEQWPYLRYLGMGAWWAWIWLCYSSTVLFGLWPMGPYAEYVGSMYLYSTPAIAAMCVLAAMLWRKVIPLIGDRRAIVLFGVLATSGTLLVGFSPWLGGTLGFLIGGILTGIGTSALCMKTGAVFGTLGRLDVLTAGCVALMFAAFLFFMGTGLPPAWRVVFVAILPLASALFYIMPSDDPFSDEDWQGRRTGSSEGTRSFVCLVIAAVMVASTASFAKGLVAASATPEVLNTTGSIVTFCIFCGSGVICFLVNCGDVVRMARTCYAALIFLGVAIVLLSGFGGSLAYLAIGKELLWMLFTCLMAYMVFRFDFSPVRAFGLGQAAYLLSSAASWWFGMLMADTLSVESSRIAVIAVMVAIIVVVYTFVFGDSDLKFILTWKSGKPGKSQSDRLGTVYGEPGDGPSDGESPKHAEPRDLTLHERVALIDPVFGISSRESEVLELFASGRSANWIAEELVISKNTVRSHIRSVYTKLNVHTRQELIDFLNAISSGN